VYNRIQGTDVNGHKTQEERGRRRRGGGGKNLTKEKVRKEAFGGQGKGEGKLLLKIRRSAREKKNTVKGKKLKKKKKKQRWGQAGEKEKCKRPPDPNDEMVYGESPETGPSAAAKRCRQLGEKKKGLSIPGQQKRTTDHGQGNKSKHPKNRRQG